MKKRVGLGILAIALVVLTFTWFYPRTAQAATSSEIRNQIDSLEEEGAQLASQMAELEESLAQNTTQLAEIVKQKGVIDQQIVVLNEQIQNTNDQVVAYGILIADKQEELIRAEQRLTKLREESKNRIREMEERGEMSYWSVLFEANTFSDFLDRVSIIQELNEADTRRLRELSDAAELVSQTKAEIEREKASLELVKQEQLQQQGILEQKRVDAEEILQQLVATGDEFKQLLLESENKQEALMSQIAQMENEYDRLAYEEWLATSVPETTQKETEPETTSSPGNVSPSEPADPSDDNGAVVWQQPLSSYVLTSPFGMRLHPILGIYRMHNGVDLSSPLDTPIYATRSGIVSVTDYEEDGAGNYIQINHGDGYRSVYMHMTRYIVSLGEYVEAGQVIGYVGSTGLSDGPHLHFGISYNGTYVNPMEYIG